MAKKRRARESTARRNPDLDTTDLTEKVLPGFAAYGVTRFLSRAAFTIAQKKKIKAARHVAVGTGLVLAAGTWAFANRVKQTQKFYEPILIGAGSAALQGILQAYMPKFGWMTGDLPTQTAAARAPGPSLDQILQNDDYEVVPLLLPGQAPPAGTVTQSQVQAEKEEDLLSELSDYSEMNDSAYS